MDVPSRTCGSTRGCSTGASSRKMRRGPLVARRRPRRPPRLHGSALPPCALPEVADAGHEYPARKVQIPLPGRPVGPARQEERWRLPDMKRAEHSTSGGPDMMWQVGMATRVGEIERLSDAVAERLGAKVSVLGERGTEMATSETGTTDLAARP